ncbi:MAG: translation initiation factor IF-2 [Rhodospirillales bacterium]|nr:translation initiation factor IF-2 [Rhodospirillales bacterium]
MTDTEDRDTKKQGPVGRPRKLELKKTVETGQVRQSFAHGRSKMVTVEVRKKRTYTPDSRGRMSEVQRGADRNGPFAGTARPDGRPRDGAAVGLTNQEKAARVRALQDAIKAEEERLAAPPEPVAESVEVEDIAESASVAEQLVEAQPAGEQTAGEQTAGEQPAEGRVDEGPADVDAAATEVSIPDVGEQESIAVSELPPGEETAETGRSGDSAAAAASPLVQGASEADVVAVPDDASSEAAPTTEAKTEVTDAAATDGAGAEAPQPAAPGSRPASAEEQARARRAPARPEARRPEGPRQDAGSRRSGKINVSVALEDAGERIRSLASVRRARERERQKQMQMRAETHKVVRDVIIPETMTVQELANRMAERSADVIKSLMKMGVMATINHTIDADTAELLAVEFGHNVRRVSAADVEIGLKGEVDDAQDLQKRPPVVTVMGHVDHGKTSLLDALRKTDIAQHEAGGITQHIGAYQVTLSGGDKITFIDTPGHAAFTQMRARGAEATDIVVLVVAADDGVMPQTVEAINHAKAAGVPLIVAINKIDRPDANPQRVRTELLQYSIQVEEMGGDVLSVEVSAKEHLNLDKLADAILLQSELLDLRANPERPAEGVIIETKVERGRGTVATVLVQRGTLRVGDIFVAGSEWGRVRGLTDASGASVSEAGPSMPVEILGLNGTPAAGDDLSVVGSEARAREVTEFRQQRTRDARTSVGRGTFEQLFSRIQQGEAKALPVVIKADVHGSAEAIVTALDKMGTDQVKVSVLHSGVGGINETDVGLARASDALIIGFNVRANPQARELAKRDGVEVRYYSIIYELADDVRAILSGMLSPILRETILGYAEIREVFNISKVGKIAGCRVIEGIVRRGGKVRLLRDNVVIHEGALGKLKHFKDDVREVREGFECGIALANFQDIQTGDKVECFELEEIAQQL